MTGAHPTDSHSNRRPVRPVCTGWAEDRAGEPNEELVTLADAVVHRLVLVGVATRSLLAHIDDPDVAGLAGPIVDGLDATINEIRVTVFDLQSRLANRVGSNGPERGTPPQDVRFGVVAGIVCGGAAVAGAVSANSSSAKVK